MTLPLDPLTPTERIRTREQARQLVIKAKGRTPERSDYDHHTASRYPPSLTRLITVLALIVLAAAFAPSAIRLYAIGSHTFTHGLDTYTNAGVLVGITTILLAESGQVIFSLALAIFLGSPNSRRLLYFGATVSTLIALVGNIELALTKTYTSPFAWLEAIAPPLLVIATAYVLKEQYLQATEQRHANERAYQIALDDWKTATADPDSDPKFVQAWADAIKHKHSRKRGQARQARALTTQQWIQLVQYEMAEHNWYTPTPPTEATQEVTAVFQENPFPANNRRNGAEEIAAKSK